VTHSVMIEDAFESTSTLSTVAYRVLSPTEPRATGRLPLILHLHGAMSSAAFLETAKPIYDAAWVAGTLPRAFVVCASTPTRGGFYIDQPNGRAWERLVGTELPDRLAARFPLSEVRAVIGFSMGGYAALKLAFRQPDRYRAVAALCPVVFPGETSAEVPEKNRGSLLGELNRAMGESPDDYSNNCVPALLRRNHDNIAASGVRILLECGELDEFGLHDGAIYLHRLLAELKVDHIWDSAPGAGHADDVTTRLEKALAFLGRALA